MNEGKVAIKCGKFWRVFRLINVPVYSKDRETIEEIISLKAITLGKRIHDSSKPPKEQIRFKNRKYEFGVSFGAFFIHVDVTKITPVNSVV